MATTTNFGWPTPDDTDLVKNGAAAMRSLGSGIDTSLVKLKGGTTGQILSKASNTDLDYTWIANDQGDITAVTAGTGITGGGTSGAVTITNSMATAIDAKGDLIAGTANDTFASLPVGSNNQVLTADSTTATGLKWAAIPTPAFVGCSLKSTTDQTISSATFTALTWDDEYFDTDNFHSNTTNNSRITIPSGKAGKYLIAGYVTFDNNTSGSRQLNIYKNGSSIYSYSVAAANFYPSGLVSFVADLAVNDYIEMFVWQGSSSNKTLYKTGNNSSFVMQYLGA